MCYDFKRQFCFESLTNDPNSKKSQWGYRREDFLNNHHQCVRVWQREEPWNILRSRVEKGAREVPRSLTHTFPGLLLMPLSGLGSMLAHGPLVPELQLSHCSSYCEKQLPRHYHDPASVLCRLTAVFLAVWGHMPQSYIHHQFRFFCKTTTKVMYTGTTTGGSTYVVSCRGMVEHQTVMSQTLTALLSKACLYEAVRHFLWALTRGCERCFNSGRHQKWKKNGN